MNLMPTPALLDHRAVELFVRSAPSNISTPEEVVHWDHHLGICLFFSCRFCRSFIHHDAISWCCARPKSPDECLQMGPDQRRTPPRRCISCASYHWTFGTPRVRLSSEHMGLRGRARGNLYGAALCSSARWPKGGVAAPVRRGLGPSILAMNFLGF